MTETIQVSLFGHFELARNGEPLDIALRSSEALLAYLILKPEQIANREHLADILWPEASGAKANLRNSLYQLRTVVGSELVLSTKEGLVLNPKIDLQVDVDPFLEADVNALSTAEIMQTLETSQGELLSDFYDDWIITERQRLHLIRERWYEVLLGRLEGADQPREVLVWAEKWIYASGAVEPAYRALMSAYAQMGNNSKVSEVYRRCQADLEHQFGVQPSKATADLYAQIMDGELPADMALAETRTSGDRRPADQRVTRGPAGLPRPLLWIGLLAGLVVLGFSMIESTDEPGLLAPAAQGLQAVTGPSDLGSQGANRFASTQYLSRPRVDLVPRILRVSERGTILISTFDGQDYGEIEVSGLYVMGASWMQANGHIVVWADPRGDVAHLGQGDFYTVDANGAIIEQLTFTQESEPKGSPDMTDDGQHIVYATGEAVNILEVDTGLTTTIVPPDGGLSWVVSAHWSPDEQHVVYMRITPACGGCEQTARLTVVDRTGQVATVVYVSEPTDRLTLQVGSVGFSPDGTMLGFEDQGAQVIALTGGDPSPASGDIWYWLPTFYPQWDAGS